MPDYYYQIKGKRAPDEPSMGRWSFPPVFSGKVTAESRKMAHKAVEEEYGRSFPLRILQKDLESNEFLLHLEEMPPQSHIARLFDVRYCESCEKPFRVIDKYNDTNCTNKGDHYCSAACKEQAYQFAQYVRNQEVNLVGSRKPVIYKITNKNTGKVYIGKTTQVFTLRWYQHFFQHGDCKFHEAIKNTPITDWTFEVIEAVTITPEMKTTKDIEGFILSRERYWVAFYNSIETGYNTNQ